MVTQRQMENAIKEAVNEAVKPLLEAQAIMEQKIIMLSNLVNKAEPDDKNNGEILDEWMNGEKNG